MTRIIPWVILLASAGATLLLAPLFGAVPINPLNMSDVLSQSILLDIRLPRVLAAFVAGGALAMCGVIFQALFRNPLADPFTLGVASGAAFGAATAILFGAAALFIVPLGAMSGAIASMILVFTLAGIRRDPSPLSLLLAGIAVSFLFSSLLMFLQYFSDLQDSFRIVRWLMGGIEVYGFAPLAIMIPVVVTGAISTFLCAPFLDQLLLGEDIAQSHGVNVRILRWLLIGTATVVVGAVVALCGPIGFVGLMVPHACRAAFGHDHRSLIPSSFIAGGTLLVACDTVARTLVAPSEIPTGVITALMGGPFFVFLMSRGYDR